MGKDGEPESEEVADQGETAAPQEDVVKEAQEVPVEGGELAVGGVPEGEGEGEEGEIEGEKGYESEGKEGYEGEGEGEGEGIITTESAVGDEQELEFDFDDADVKASEAKGKGKDAKKKGKDKGAKKKEKGEDAKKDTDKAKKVKPKEDKPKKEKKPKKEQKESQAEDETRMDKKRVSIMPRTSSSTLRSSISKMHSWTSRRFSSSVRMRASLDSISSGSGSLSSGESLVDRVSSVRVRVKKGKEGVRLSVEEDKPKGKSKKKEKGKGKKKKMKEAEEGEEIIFEEKEIITQDLNEEAKPEGEGEPPPKKEKKPKKGKKKGKKEKPLTPKEQARLEEERKRNEAEKAAREAEELRLRLIEEKRLAVEKDKREVVEQQLRIEQLDASSEYLKEIQQAGHDAYMADKLREEWDKYLVCDGRPDPADVPQMNTYLHLWGNEIETINTDQAIYRTNEMYNLLEKLQELIDDPFDVSEAKQADWKWIRSMFRDLQEDNLNFCTYRLIRNIDTKLNRIDIPTADFRLKEENFALCLWVPVQLPIPMPNPRNPSRPRVHMDWPEMSMNVLFPNSLDCETLVLRAMYVRYNHLSDTTISYPDPPIPEPLNKDLSEKTANEWFIKLNYKYNNRVIEPREPTYIVNEEGDAIAVDPEPELVLEPGELPPIVPYQRLEPTASEYAINIEDEEIGYARQNLELEVPDHVINLRKYVILGGVYYLDLFVQPTQPQEMVSFEIFITNLILPCRIEKAPFYVEYLPLPPPAPGVRRQPEEIEEELIKQEQEFDKLIFVTLHLPKHILWMDVPIICQWDEETKEWTTVDVHDFKHIEEKGFVTFRTGKFGPFAIATFKYPNFPFQAWELRPEADGSVTFQITAAILLVEFHIKDHMVCLTQVQNAPNHVMDQHLNVYYKLPYLIRIMREAGVDIFPAFDTFFYVEGTCEKYWPMEKQTYYGMAMTAIAYNFSWSRWNMTSDYRTIVMQARLHRFDKPKQLNFSTCMVTPTKAVMIECTEVSPAFSDEPSEGMKFYADFYHLIKSTSNMATKDRISESNLAMVNSLSKLLIATRFLSFS